MIGDLSNLIGSLSRTIQQYSLPNEWIMCELGVFLENDLSKVDKILALTFCKGNKKLGRIQNGVSPFTAAEFCARWIMLTTPVYSRRRSHFVNSAFPNKKTWPKNLSLFITNKFESKCLQMFAKTLRFK